MLNLCHFLFQFSKINKKKTLCIPTTSHSLEPQSRVHRHHQHLRAWFGHSFQNRTEPGGRTVKTGNRDENRFFKPKEPDFLLIPWTVKTGVGPQEPVRTVRSNPLAIFFFLKQLNTILFYLIKLSISYKE